MRSMFRGVAVAVLAVLAIGSGGGASPPTSDPPTAAAYGAAWLAAQVQDDGSVPGGFDPLGDAGNAALALAAAGVGGDAFDRVVDRVRSDIEDFVAYPFDPSIDDPGRLGKAIMVAVLAGEDPRSFGGTDLVARLEATLGLYEPGLYGAADPTFDGVFRQSLALAGLVAAGVGPAPEAVTWLRDQQCGPTNPEASGGWQAYRPPALPECADPDPLTFAGPDTNSSAMATLALEAVAAVPSTDPLDFFVSSQEGDGGWGFIPGGGSDPSSTALVIRALVASGVDPESIQATGGDPWDSLLSWQLGCDSPSQDRGAFTFPWADPPGAPDLFSTLDAIQGAAAAPLPIPAPEEAETDLPEVICRQAGATTTSTTSTIPVSGEAVPVGGTPAFTG